MNDERHIRHKIKVEPPIRMKSDGFTQLCVWEGMILEEGDEQGFITFMLQEFDVRVQYHTQVLTNPSIDGHGIPIRDTGGRNDLFFYVHKDDVGKFAVPRLKAGIRWWEDIFFNGQEYLYQEHFVEEHPPTW